MLIWLTKKGFRARAAVMLVLAYALCVLTPAAALAFGDSSRAAHCLTGDHHAAPATNAHGDHAHSDHTHSDRVHSGHAVPHGHSHASGTAHDHAQGVDHAQAKDDDGKASDSRCCGLMCLPAIPATAIEFAPVEPRASLVAIGQDVRSGRGPGCLLRPPSTPLSF